MAKPWLVQQTKPYWLGAFQVEIIGNWIQQSHATLSLHLIHQPEASPGIQKLGREYMTNYRSDSGPSVNSPRQLYALPDSK